MVSVNRRNVGVCILLSLLTFGIYAIYWMYLLVKNVRALKQDDSSCTGEMLCLLLIPFYSLYWWYTKGNEVKSLMEKQNCQIASTGTLYLVLNILFLGIVAMAIMQNDFNALPGAGTAPRSQQRWVIYVFLVIWALVVLFPFYWMVLTSLKSFSAYNSEYIPRFFTASPTIENYSSAFSAVPLARYFLNTLIFTVATTGMMMLVIIPAAFAFARLEFKGRNAVFALFLSLMMIPTELVIITNYVTIVNWNLRNTYTGLILPSITNVFYIYLLKENFEAIPDELYQAAKVDGTSDLKYLIKVMIPICQPTVVTIVILKVIECWNSYVWPRLITYDANYFLVSNGIQEIRENGFGRENTPAMMAAVVVISIPLIVLFLVFRKKIMAGVSRGGTKG